jgi:membrane protein implicated in regulation of membrane protease activity
MDTPEHRELLKLVAELRRETRSLRRWVIFIAVCAAILLFIPQLASFAAATVGRMLNMLGETAAPVVAVPIIVVVAAVLVSHFSRSASQPAKPEADNV